MADVYLGYIPDLDVFVSVWDLYDDNTLGNVVFIKFIGIGNAKVTKLLDFGTSVYNKDGSISILEKELHNDTIVDFKLD